MRKTLSTRLAVLFGAGALMAAACGDNIKPGGGDDDDDDDTVPIDAEVPDMEPPPVFTGTITVLEATVFGASQTVGQGIQVAASFFENGGVPPVLDEQPGSPIGCKVWEYTPAQAADVGLDEGTVSVTIDNHGTPAFNPDIPDCTYVPTRGYMCIDTVNTGPATIERVMTSGTTCAPGVLKLRDVDAPFDFAVTDGRYVSFTGSGITALPDGAAFPIIGAPFMGAEAPSTSMMYFAHPSIPAGGTLEACADIGIIPIGGAHTTLGGVGPIPFFDDMGSTQPGFLSNDATVSVTLTSGGDGDIETFTADFPMAMGGPGNDFALEGDSADLFTPTQAGGAGIPLDGTAFTVACDTANGCGAGSGDGVVLSITTTDADLTNVPATTLPLPMTKRVVVRCAALASNSVTVSAAASARLMSSGATKLQATFVRGELSGNAAGTVNVVAGHAITTFQVVPTTKK